MFSNFGYWLRYLRSSEVGQVSNSIGVKIIIIIFYTVRTM